MVGKFPALIILPIFGYFTFGKVNGLDTPAVCLNWKSTFVNMATSVALTASFGLIDNIYSCQSLLYSWILDSGNNQRLTLNYYMFEALISVCSVMLTILIYWNPTDEYGVLLADHPDQPHLMRNDHLVAMTNSLEPMYNRQVDTF